ncbi:MAG: nucleotide exchange factor GrpE [Candidatus Pacebacteria bacterium]|nr:nucleotide exchange factor GrpE [Candidatus Paceibacterota bacterium]
MKDDEDVMVEPEFVESNEDGDELAGSDKIKKLQEKIKTLEKEKTEYLDGWQRARADYANLQKSTDEDKKRFREHFAQRFVEDLLPVVDSFSMAMSNKEAWEKVDANWRTGVEYIYNQLMTALSEHDLEVFGKVGETFDPTLHEAVSDTETDDTKLDHTIASVLQQGYKLGDNILRAARVNVYKAK